jgi:PAS domain S-box-containing protein
MASGYDRVIPERAIMPGAGTQSEQTLRRAQRQVTELEAIFSAHADGLVLYGPDGEIRSMNPAARELFGIGDDAATDYSELTRTLAPIDAAGDPLPIDELPSRRAMRGELVKGFVMAVHTAAGLVWYSASAAPLWTEDGAIAGAVLSCVDITRLQRLKEEREQVIRALTHDARTRLNVIRTHGEVLGRAPVHPDDVRRRAGVIVSSTGQLADIIDALVDGR